MNGVNGDIMPTLKFTVSRGSYAGVHPSDTEIPARQPEVEQGSSCRIAIEEVSQSSRRGGLDHRDTLFQ